jgi:hypothetical protein
MADNAETASGTGLKVATDKVTYSGDADENVQLVRKVGVSGSEGSKVVYELPGNINTITLKHTTITTAVTDAAVITVSSGTRIVVTAFTITLDNASTVFPTVLLGFGATNTPTTTGVLGAHGGVPAGGGFSRGDGSGILGIGADNDDLRITTTGNATGNGLQLIVTYYTIPA